MAICIGGNSYKIILKVLYKNKTKFNYDYSIGGRK